MRAHPAEGELQALLDGELSPAREMLVRAHLVRCASCRARIAAARSTASMVNALIRRSAPAVDGASAWERLVVRSGGRLESERPARTRWISAAALVIAAAALALGIARATSESTPGDAFALVREAQAHPTRSLLRDACCSDHDGGDRQDDGLLTVSNVGEKVTTVIVYEDVDHSGTFTPGDIVRYVSTIPRGSKISGDIR